MKKTIKEWQDENISVKNIDDCFGEKNQPDVTIATYHRLMLDDVYPSERKRLRDYDIIFLDECHRAFGEKTFKSLITRYPNSIIIGLSATPYLGATMDPKKLRSAFEYFEGEIDSISLKEACEDGDLAPIRAMRIEVNLENMTEEDDTDEKMNKKLNYRSRSKIAKHLLTKEIPKEEKSIVFCVNIKHAKDTEDILRKSGIKAFAVHSEMSRTKINTILKEYANGSIDCLISADLLFEGFDDHKVKHVIMLRPTMALWMYEQMLGRGSRLDAYDPGKILTVWDVVGQHSKQCTVFGLSELYEQHKESYINGEIVFAPKELKENFNKKLRNPEEDREKIGGRIGENGTIRRIIEVERVGKIQTPRDEAYYRDGEKVRYDLEAFAKEISKENYKENQSVFNITARNIRKSQIICHNLELIRGRSYVDNAGIKLGISDVQNFHDLKTTDIMEQLFQIANLQKRNRSYYENHANIKEDMVSFTKDLLEDFKHMNDFRIHDIVFRKLNCKNGEEISLNTYLLDAIKLYDKSITSDNITNLDRLKKLQEFLTITKNENLDVVDKLEQYIIDFSEVVRKKARRFALMDNKYCFDEKQAKSDLEEMSQILNIPIVALDTKNILSSKITNEFGMGGSTYTRYLAKKFKLSPSDAFIELKDLASALRNQSYYQNSKNVRNDLEGFANEIGVTIFKLSATKMYGVRSRCCNHEVVSGHTYLYDAMKLGESDSSICHKRDKLKELKRTAGIIERDKEYYLNSDFVKQDLEKFVEALSQQLNKEATISDLKIKYKDLGIVCSNGEEATFHDYVNVAHNIFKVSLGNALKKLIEVSLR